jgi:hypothetical protein
MKRKFHVRFLGGAAGGNAQALPGEGVDSMADTDNSGSGTGWWWLVAVIAVLGGIWFFNKDKKSVPSVFRDPPQGEVIKFDLNFELLGSHGATVHVRNNGGDGLIKVRVNAFANRESVNALRTWDQNVYLHRGEDRVLKFELSGESVLDNHYYRSFALAAD